MIIMNTEGSNNDLDTPTNVQSFLFEDLLKPYKT